jgi:fructokinase
MAKTIIAYGETLWDLLPTGAVLGGAPFNFCYRAASLGNTAFMVTRLGRDDYGRQAWKAIEALGMDTQFVQWDDDEPTGTVDVDLTDPDNPDFTILPDVAYDNVQVTEELLAAAEDADCVCYGTLSQRTPTGRETCHAVLEAAAGALKLLDINLRKSCFTPESVVASLERADVLKLNDDEALRIDEMLDRGTESIPEFAEAMIADFGLTVCVVTFGAAGAFAVSAGGSKTYSPGYAVELADSCGSGDAFAAGFIHRLLEGADLTECCLLGNALGAMVATQEGATVPISMAEVEAFLAAEHERVTHPDMEPFQGT